jgi:predicted nucleic acid-binding protein
VPYLLDTSALLAHYRNEAGSDQVQALFDAEEEEILLCSVSIPEFMRRLRELGASQAEAADALAGYRQVVDEVVAVDEPVAGAGDELIRSIPGRLPLVDALIAAAARSRGATLVHRDSHMRQIPRDLLQQFDLTTP